MPYAGLGVFFGSLNEKQQEQVLAEVRKIAAFRFEQYRDAAIKGVDMPKLKPEDALNAYRARSPEMWSEWEKRLPDRHTEQLQDWSKLEEQARTRLASRIDRVTEDPVKSLARSLSAARLSASQVTQNAT